MGDLLPIGFCSKGMRGQVGFFTGALNVTIQGSFLSLSRDKSPAPLLRGRLYLSQAHLPVRFLGTSSLKELRRSESSPLT